MKHTHLSVIAVIPAHNNAKTLPPLLDELIKQKYDDIYVIDDASTDDTVKIVKSYGSKVKLIENDENVGSGANRNRIIGRAAGSILHFIDADMLLLSKNTPDIIRGLKWYKDTAYIGGLIRNPDGQQNPFNYGPRASVITTLQSWIQYAIWSIGRYAEPPARLMQMLFYPMLHTWPNIYRTPKRRQTFWTAESNMIIRPETYEWLGGYDPIFRYSEVTDFALRLHRLGLKTYFDPRIDTIHGSIDNILCRSAEKSTAFRQYVKKHGHVTFVIPGLGDHLAGRKTQKRYHK